MAQLKPTKTVYTVGDFLDWQRNGSLNLKPVFQRRQVWGSKAKSLLIDSVLKGLPVPIIFLRKAQDLVRLSSRLEVVDGQQRLRTLFSFIDPSVLADYSGDKDDFTVLSMHNPDPDISNRPFRKLSLGLRSAILGYEISTHVLPPDTADEMVLRIFSRLNSTGAKLNRQELRNAQFFGAFKSIVYDLAIKNLPQWRKWGVFDDDDFARMLEVENVSDLLTSILRGDVQGKSQKKLDLLYEKYDDEFKGGENVAARFQRVMDAIDETVGTEIVSSSVKRQALFYSFFTACYDHMYGLRSKYTLRKAPRALPADLPGRLVRMSRLIRAGRLPEAVMDAIRKSTTDKGRRTTRHKFFLENLGFVPFE